MLLLNIHHHALVLDGVYTRSYPLAHPEFHSLPAPSRADIEEVLSRFHRRLRSLLERHGQQDGADTSADYDSILAHLAASSIRGRVATGPSAGAPLDKLFVHTEPTDEPPRPELSAHMDGFSLHAGVAIEADRRGKLEHLCRYIARPPISNDRLSIDERGRVLYQLRHPFSDGTTHVVFTPTSFLERLCALIPRPRAHLLTYHGVLAPASTWREDIVPRSSVDTAPRGTKPSPSQTALRRRLRWAELIKRVFDTDVLICECGARRDVIACITDRWVAGAILRHLGLNDQAPVSAPSRAPPVLDFGA